MYYEFTYGTLLFIFSILLHKMYPILNEPKLIKLILLMKPITETKTKLILAGLKQGWFFMSVVIRKKGYPGQVTILSLGNMMSQRKYDLRCKSMGCWRKSKYPEITYGCTIRTCKLIRKIPGKKSYRQPSWFKVTVESLHWSFTRNILTGDDIK